MRADPEKADISEQERGPGDETAEIVASGMVQGIGFRYHVRALAVKLRLTGHVKNSDDGTVEISCEGDQGGIDALIEGMRAMKPPVAVEDVRVEYSDVRGFTKFEMILGDQLREMAEGFGTGAAYMGLLLDKQDQTIAEIRGLS